MTSTEDLSDLKRRLDEATSGSRELDVLIWAEFDGRDVRVEKNTLIAKARRAPHDECVLGWIDPGKVARNFTVEFSRPPFPHLTTSVDAALALAERLGLSIVTIMLQAMEGLVTPETERPSIAQFALALVRAVVEGVEGKGEP